MLCARYILCPAVIHFPVGNVPVPLDLPLVFGIWPPVTWNMQTRNKGAHTWKRHAETAWKDVNC